MTTLGVVVNPSADRGHGQRVGTHAIEALRRRGHTVEDLSAPDLEAATARGSRTTWTSTESSGAISRIASSLS